MDKRIQFLSIMLLLTIPFIPFAFADGLYDFDYYHETLAGLSFIVAGLLYSSLGYARKAMRALSGEDVTFDYSKMGKSVVLGIVLGIAAFVWTGVEGEVIKVENLKEFAAQVGLNSAAIMIVHKLLLGRKESKETEVGTLPVPPGKGL